MYMSKIDREKKNMTTTELWFEDPSDDEESALKLARNRKRLRDASNPLEMNSTASKVVSTKQQLETLVSLMHQNPSLARGVYSKSQATKKWEEITTQLNCLGPPVRTPEKWIKAWADMKSKTKKKNMENKAEFRATGGGPNRLHILTQSEEVISALLGYETSANPPGQDHGLRASGSDECQDVSEYQNAIEQVSIEIVEDLVKSDESDDAPEERPRVEKRKRNSKTDRLRLLEEQTNDQKKFHAEMLKKMEAMKESVAEIATFTERMYNIKYYGQRELVKLKREKLELYKSQLKK